MWPKGCCSYSVGTFCPCPCDAIADRFPLLLGLRRVLKTRYREVRARREEKRKGTPLLQHPISIAFGLGSVPWLWSCPVAARSNRPAHGSTPSLCQSFAISGKGEGLEQRECPDIQDPSTPDGASLLCLQCEVLPSPHIMPFRPTNTHALPLPHTHRTPREAAVGARRSCLKRNPVPQPSPLSPCLPTPTPFPRTKRATKTSRHSSRRSTQPHAHTRPPS